MPPIHPVIAPEIFALRRDFRALSIDAANVVNLPAAEVSTGTLAIACQAPCSEPWAEAHREAWRDAYRAFGAKPQRTPCSAEALLKRATRDGSVPAANAVVDLYNAVSLRFAIPVGGENADAYVGMPRLERAAGDELFETVQAGQAQIVSPEAGEVIWRDELGVTCRRWNWRQGVRTRIDLSTTNMWFVLEALDPMPDGAVMDAGSELVRGLTKLSARITFEARLLRREGTTSVSL